MDSQLQPLRFDIIVWTEFLQDPCVVFVPGCFHCFLGALGQTGWLQTRYSEALDD